MSLIISKQVRKEMEELVYNVFDKLDPSKTNGDKYREMFGKMSDNEFKSYFEYMFENENQYLILDTVDYERDISMENIEAAAKVIGVPLFEKVIMPHINMDTNQPVLTKYEVPVGYVPIKRMQQTLAKKNTTSTEAATRSALTNQVVGKDKNARGSDTENFAMVTINAENNLREFLGPRSDDMVMKNEMHSSIAQKQFVSLNSLTNNVANKTTLNAVDVQLIAMGVKSDLVTDGLAVRKTIKK
ncbi:hypothetical protein D1872_38780 [compost metagenome]